jgi:hypothetical protein
VTANVKAITCCLGYQQLATVSSATGLTVPARDPISGMDVKANFALIVAETQDVRWRDDGTDPTASVGMLLKAGVIFQYDGDLKKIKFIETTGSAKVNVSYYV